MSQDLEIKYKGRTVVPPNRYGYIPRTKFPPGVLRCLVTNINLDSVEMDGVTCDVEYCGGDVSYDGEEDFDVKVGNVYPTEREAFEASMALQLEEADAEVNRIAKELKAKQDMRDKIMKVGASYGK